MSSTAAKGRGAKAVSAETLNTRKRGKSFTRRNLPLHLMILPAVILVFIYKYIPMAGSVIAFENFKLSKGVFGSKWVGWDNFKYILNMPDFWPIIRNTLRIAIGKLIFNLVVPIVVALMLNELANMKLKRSIQTILYIPNFLSWIILAGMFSDVLGTGGIVNTILVKMGLKAIPFLSSDTYFPGTMITTDVWKNFGYGTIVYLSALASIDPSLYETARLDGANRWQQTLHVTLPGIRPIIVLMALLSMGSVLNAGFDQIYNLLNPMVYGSGQVIDTYVYTMSMSNGMYGPATALGLMNSLVSFLLVSIGYILADKLADYRIF